MCQLSRNITIGLCRNFFLLLYTPLSRFNTNSHKVLAKQKSTQTIV